MTLLFFNSQMKQVPADASSLTFVKVPVTHRNFLYSKKLDTDGHSHGNSASNQKGDGKMQNWSCSVNKSSNQSREPVQLNIEHVIKPHLTRFKPEGWITNRQVGVIRFLIFRNSGRVQMFNFSFFLILSFSVSVLRSFFLLFPVDFERAIVSYSFDRPAGPGKGN